MTPANKLIQEILLHLKEGSLTPEATSRLASDYAGACREANARLDQIEAVLDGGDERQALLLAERYPPIMDEVDALCFAEAENWKIRCQHFGLPLAPSLKVPTVQRLSGIYAKGIKPGHAIYKEFRTAILSKDDETALQLARTIEKANPADTQAAKERARLEKKVWQQRVTALEEIIPKDEPTVIEQALLRVEELQPLFAEQPEPPALAEARGKLQAWQAGIAHKHCVEWMRQMEGLQERGDWQTTAEVLARVDEAVRTHNLTLDREMLNQLDGARVFVQKSHQEFLTQNAFQAALRELFALVETIDSENQARGVTSLSRLTESLTHLNRAWQKVSAFARPVDADLTQRVERMVQYLRAEIANSQKRRLFSWAAILLVVLAVTSASGWWLLGLYRASESAKEIANATDSRLVVGTEKLISLAEERELTRFSSGLERQIEASRSWIASQKKELSVLENEVATFEAMAVKGFENESPADWMPRVASLEEALQKLPPEFQAEVRQRFQTARPVFEVWVRDARSKLTEDWQQKIEAFTTELFEPLINNQSMEQFATALVAAERAISGWDSEEETVVSELRPSEQLKSTMQALRRAVESYREQLEDLQAAVSSLAEVGTVEEYREALNQASESPLFQIEEVQKMRSAIFFPTDPDRLVSHLVFPWQPEAWAAFVQGGESEDLHPKEITVGENRFLSTLFNSEFVSGIYQNDVQGKPNRLVFSKGEPLGRSTLAHLNRQTNDFTDYYTWSGEVYDPEVNRSDIRFSPRRYSQRGEGHEYASGTTDRGLAPSSSVFDRMRLRDLLDNTSIRLSVWELLDRANAAGVKSPIYQAYLAQQFTEMMKLRRFAWGGHFTPSGQEFLLRLNMARSGQPLNNGDWLRFAEVQDDKSRAMAAALQSDTHFLAEAKLNRALALAVKQAGGLQFAGYLDAEGQPVLTRGMLPPDALWGWAGVSPNQAPGLLFSVESEGGDEPVFTLVETAPPYSPLFTFPGNRRQTLKQAMDASFVSEDLLSRLQLPPIFRLATSP